MISPTNYLFALARRARRLLPWYLVIILAIVFLLGASLIGAFPAAALLLLLNGIPSASSPAFSAAQQLILLLMSYVPVYILVFGWMWLYEKRPPWTAGLKKTGFLSKYIRGAGLGVLLIALAVGTQFAFGAARYQSGQNTFTPQVFVAVLMILPGWIVQGGGEELLTRGWMLPVIGAKYTPLLGVFLSSITFAFFHSLNPNLNPISIVNLFLFAVFAALYALADRSLWGVFGLHAAWNWAEGNLFSLPVSGMDFQNLHLLPIQTISMPLLTGGAFGPEGGLAVTVILLLAILLVWLFGNRKKQDSSEKLQIPL